MPKELNAAVTTVRTSSFGIPCSGFNIRRFAKAQEAP